MPDKSKRLKEIEYKARFIFSEEKFAEIKREIDRICLCFLKHTLPQKCNMPATLTVPIEELKKHYNYWGYNTLSPEERKDVIFTFLASIREHLEPLFKEHMLEL
jgi:hypothetical protein